MQNEHMGIHYSIAYKLENFHFLLNKFKKRFIRQISLYLYVKKSETALRARWYRAFYKLYLLSERSKQENTVQCVIIPYVFSTLVQAWIFPERIHRH